MPGVQPLELPFRSSQRVDDSIRKGGKEFVGQRRVMGEQAVTGIVFNLQKLSILDRSARPVASAAIDQRYLPHYAAGAHPLRNSS